MHKLLIVICLLLFGCNSTPQECPECPMPEECPPYEECIPCVECPQPIICDSLECPEGYTLVKSELKFECVKDSPEYEVDPSDYIGTGRAGGIIINVETESRSDIYLEIWSSVRDNIKVADNCADICTDILFMSASELKQLAGEGQDLLNQWNNKWKANLSTINWRCREDERFCGKTNVRKVNWTPYLERLKAHRTLTNLNRELVHKDPLAACAFDTIAGWCECRNKLR